MNENKSIKTEQDFIKILLNQAVILQDISKGTCEPAAIADISRVMLEIYQTLRPELTALK